MSQVIFAERDFTSQFGQPDLDYAVERYSWNVIGGPKQAKIIAFGSDVDLWRLIEMVRSPVYIYTRYGDAAWWGYVADVRLTVKSAEAIRNPSVNQRVQVGVSVDTFYNSIQVAFTELIPPEEGIGERTDTAWADDDDSQAEYGIRELLWTKDNATPTHAETARDMKLEQVKYPIPVISQTRSKISKATLICRGLWDTLGWRYYEKLGTNYLIETSTQIETILSAKGQFFSGVDLEVASGIDISDFRDGDATALFEVTQMLEMGTDNDLRMLASVTQSRRVLVTEEPEKTAQPHLIKADGDWEDGYGTAIRKELCPVGVWARMKNVIPPSVDSSSLADPSSMFIEENEYIVAKDALNHFARGAPDPWEFPTVKDG
jgi:hypothetical protein